MRETELDECVKEYNYLLGEAMKLMNRAYKMREYAKELHDVDIGNDRSVN